MDVGRIVENYGNTLHFSNAYVAYTHTLNSDVYKLPLQRRSDNFVLKRINNEINIKGINYRS